MVLILVTVVVGACDGGRGGESDGSGSGSTIILDDRAAGEYAIHEDMERASEVSVPPENVKPKLDEVTLQAGDVTLRPVGPASVGQHMRDVGGRRIAINKGIVSATRIGDQQQLWSSQSADGRRLRWVTCQGNVGLLLGYDVDDEERFAGYESPVRIRRIDLDSGQWLADLPIQPDDGGKVKALLSAQADQGALAVLVSLTSLDESGGAKARVVAYQVTCFRGDEPTPLWTKTFEAEEERGYGGVYVWGITPPRYAYSDNRHLTWLEETLIVAAEDMQPIMALNRDTGTKIWTVDKIWEYERGFIGPSVYCHYIERFGIEDLRFDKGKDGIEAARRTFNQQFSCAVIGGPVVVPLEVPRRSDAYSIFVAVSKAAARRWSGYLADCVVYELSENGTPISMVKVPQLVSGGNFKVLKDGLVWAGQNDSLMRLMPSLTQPIIGMGGGGTDLITRLAWFRQIDWQPPHAWLTTGRAAQPVAFSQSQAFRLPGGGYITNKGDHDYHFPITATDLSSGIEQELVLHVPFEGTISAPGKGRTDTEDRVSTATFHVMAITDLRADDRSLDVTIGMEKWSATLTFSLDSLEGDTTSASRQDEPTRDYTARIEQFGSPKKLSEELLDAAHGYDAEYVQALLKAGADPRHKSNNGWTALMVSACYGSADIVDLLIAAGSDVNAQDNNCGGQTVLMWAARSGQQSIRKVRALLKAGAAIEGTTFSGDWTALLSAVNGGNIAVVELLISKGANVHVKDEDDHGLLWHARDRGNQQLVEMLESHGIKE